jgi:hypothetical protein
MTLAAARAAVERGDKAAAMAAVDAALELDPNFLAAHSLRDRIVAGEIPGRAQPPTTEATHLASTGEARPIASADGYANFEQRARRRRVDRRVDAARQAIERKHLRHAAAALDEVIELDPNLPELSELTAQFDELRRSTAGTHRGPWLAAAAVLAGSVLGASWFQESASPLPSRSMIALAPLLAAPTTSVSLETDVERAATIGVSLNPDVESAPEPRRIVRSIEPPVVHAVATSAVARPAVGPVVELPAVVPPSPPQAPPQALPPQTPPQSTPVSAPMVVVAPRPVQEAIVAASITVPVPPKSEGADDPAMVRQVLQRYRSAYEGLDARSAQAVWPAVNEVALARAFDGLESQKLIFDACEVRVRGEAATAICQGSARYVPKIGNREPRTEPRVWNFILHKAGDDWKIDSARAER